MTRKIDLTVNNVPIELDYYVSGYLDHVVGGIITSLRDTGEIQDLKMTIDKGRVTIDLNGSQVPLKPFPMNIITSTMSGVVAPLKGVDQPMETLEIDIQR